MLKQVFKWLFATEAQATDVPTINMEAQSIDVNINRKGMPALARAVNRLYRVRLVLAEGGYKPELKAERKRLEAFCQAREFNVPVNMTELKALSDDLRIRHGN